jgi:diacylglycerol kinase family enzyme
LTTTAAVSVILNPMAGTVTSTTVLRQRLVELFGQHRLEPRIVCATTGDDLPDLARRAVHQGSQTIVAGGGDGTVSAVASVLAHMEGTLGIIPLGTLNHFAKDVGVPLDLAGAVRTICAGHTVRVDVGDVNGRLFVNNSSLGLYPRIVRDRERQQQHQGYGKWTALARATLRVLYDYPFLRLHLCFDGRTVARRTPFVLIGNNEYELGIPNSGSRPRLDAGRLSLCLAPPVGRLGLVRGTVRLLAGRPRRPEDFCFFTAREIVISARRRRLRVATDGEVTTLQTPLHYRICPGALRVLAPAL